MNRALIVISAIILALAAVGCAPVVRNGRQAADTASAAGPAPAAAAAEPAADAYERRSAGAGRTFLDTLNRGKEIGVAADDLPAIIEMSAAPTAPAAPAPANAPAAPPPAAGPRFHIQILASGQVDMVRREQQKAEIATNLPVMMVAEQSLFKLFVGDFRTRAEAEAALPNVKRDYPDAWIVSK